MTRVQFRVIVALLSVIACLLAAPIFVPDRTGPRWDYRIESLEDETFIDTMNWLGDGGWEMVFARRAIDKNRDAGYEVIFRRPR